MNYSFSRIQGRNGSWDRFTSECLHSVIWYQFILSTALIYYLVIVLSMIFTKESRRLRQISLLHDNVIMFIMLTSLVEWFGFASDDRTALMVPLSTHGKIQVVTCSSIVFLHTSLQASFMISISYTIYAENILFPKMASIKPKPICNVRFIVWQVTTGLTVALATALIGTSNKESFTNGCCLQPFIAGSLEKAIDLTFDCCTIYAAYILLRVSIDRFLKLIVTARQRPSFVMNARLQVL